MLLGAVEEVIYLLLFYSLGDQNANNSTIQLYFSKSPDQWMVPINSTDSSLIDPTKDVYFIVHGFNESLDFYMYGDMTRALIETGVNVISLDWSILSVGLNYIAATKNVEIAGHYLGNYIVNQKLDLEKVHLVGFSLGAHVCGIAAKVVKNSGGIVKRVIGLDPAGPLYGLLEPIPDNRRLGPNDGKLVITLSTNRLVYGSRFQFGKVNFMANAGTLQPGCLKDFTSSLIPFLCSHRRAVQIYTEAVNSTRFVGKGVSTFLLPYRFVEPEETLVFENDISEGTVGKYQFDTNNNSPYARG